MTNTAARALVPALSRSSEPVLLAASLRKNALSHLAYISSLGKLFSMALNVSQCGFQTSSKTAGLGSVYVIHITADGSARGMQTRAAEWQASAPSFGALNMLLRYSFLIALITSRARPQRSKPCLPKSRPRRTITRSWDGTIIVNWPRLPLVV